MIFDFEVIYKEYPRKEGKFKGMEYLKKHIKSAGAYAELATGVKNYAQAMASEGRDKQFILMWSTFCTNRRWQDYLEEASADNVVKLKQWF